jgi:hypothetical protein
LNAFSTTILIRIGSIKKLVWIGDLALLRSGAPSGSTASIVATTTRSDCSKRTAGAGKLRKYSVRKSSGKKEAGLHPQVVTSNIAAQIATEKCDGGFDERGSTSL